MCTPGGGATFAISTWMSVTAYERGRHWPVLEIRNFSAQLAGADAAVRRSREEIRRARSTVERAQSGHKRCSLRLHSSEAGS